MPLIDAQDKTLSVSVEEVIEELESKRADNNTYLDELELLHHEDPTAEEYNQQIIEYVQMQNLYIDETLQSIKSGSDNLPDASYIQELGSLVNEQISDFRYEEK